MWVTSSQEGNQLSSTLFRQSRKQFATRSISPQPFLPPLAHAQLTAGRPARSGSGGTADETQQVTKQLANASRGDPEVSDEVEDAVHAALIAETALTDNGP